MTEINQDVDLYAELRATLEAVDESSEEETEVASDQEPTTESTVETPNEDENVELNEDDISKLSPRAQKRIREQAEEIKRLSELSKEEPEVNETSPQDFKNVQDFLNAVEDEPSRKLLEKFYGVMKLETSSVLAPIEQKNNETKFETEFSKYDKVDGLADYKNDLKKTFMRNPNQSFKALIGETIADLTLNKIKPIEKTPSTPNRGKVDTANLSKDELYDVLDTLRE